MGNKDTALKVAGVIFLLVAIAHFFRLVRRIPLIAGGITVPLHLSLFGFAGALLLAIWMFTASKKEK